MQECQNDATSGRSSRVFCAPSSYEDATRNVGPIRRMNQYPTEIMMRKMMRWRSVKRRGARCRLDARTVLRECWLQARSYCNGDAETRARGFPRLR